MPQPWYRKFQKPKPANQGAKAGVVPNARNWATWKPTGYITGQQANALQAYQASLQHYVTADQAAKMMWGKEQARNPRVKNLNMLSVGGLTTPQGWTEKQTRAYWTGRIKEGLATPQAQAVNIPKPPTPATPLLPAGAYNEQATRERRWWLEGLPQSLETTPAPTTTPEYPSGGYGGYGYPYYGGGGWGGGGVNINFGGGRQQQQIARLPTTPQPDIQGWLQSLINWNIGG